MERKLRVAIFEPSRISKRGGGQKVAAKIAGYLSQKHYVEVFTQKHPKKNLDFGKAKITLIKPSNRFLAMLAFLIKKVRGFDLIITGEFPSSLASIRNKPSLNICCSPTRALYDLKEYLWKNSDFKGKLKIIIKNILFKRLEKVAVKKTKYFLSISKNVQERVKKYYKRNSDIFYVGIDYNKFKFQKYGDYILSVSRLVNAKRVNILIESMKFVKNKRVKLYVVGEGEDEEKIKKLCEKYDNVTFIGTVDDKKLIKLYANCLALAYIPIDEDWGLVPIEAAASKKTTIGVNEGGLKETIINVKTGFLLDKVTPEKIAEKIDFLIENKTIAEKMGKGAFVYCKKFDWKGILFVLDKTIEKTLSENI